MEKQALRYYDFGPFRLSVTDRLLLRDDEVVSLTPKLIDTLLILVENRGHVLTKDVLLDTLWPDSFVEESSLTQNISLLRKALSENGSTHQYIETIPKRGYRFVGDVQEVTSPNGSNGANGELLLQERLSTQVLIEEHIVHDSKEPAPLSSKVTIVPARAANSRKLQISALAIAIVSIAALTIYWFRAAHSTSSFVPNSIAVLPFNSIGSQSEPDLMGLGMADAVILKLNRLNRPKVLPTSSIYKYTKRDKDVLSIGRDLGVDAVLDGTVQRDSDRVRVTAVLIRLRDGKTVWSEKFDSPYTGVFDLQDAVSERVVAALIPSINDRNTEAPRRRMTENVEAYQAYLTGLYFWNLRTKQNLSKAISYLEQAVQKDNNFALAHAILADAYYLSFQDAYALYPRSESISKATASVQRALELDDSIVEAHTAKAGIAFADMKYDESDKEFRRALELNPNYALAHLRYGYLLFANSKLDEAVSEMKRSKELDPVSPVSHIACAYLLFMARDFDGAETEIKKGIELQPDNMVAHLNLADLYIQKGRFKEAEDELNRLPKSEPLVSHELVYLYARSGREKEASLALAEFKRSASPGEMRPYDYAMIYAALGDKDSAFVWLQKVSYFRFMNAMLKFDARLDPLRSDKRFAEVLQRASNEERSNECL